MEKMKYDNDKIINNFTEKEKEELFQDLMSMYFHKNFGSVSKADLELFIFSFYLDHLMKKGDAYDDYTLSKDLGLTQSRIRSLKERKVSREIIILYFFISPPRSCVYISVRKITKHLPKQKM